MAIALWRSLYQMWWWTDGYRGTQQIPAGSQSPYPYPTVSGSSFWLLALPTASGSPTAKAGVQGKDSTPHGPQEAEACESWSAQLEKQGNEMNSEASCWLCFLASNILGKVAVMMSIWRRKKTGHSQIIQFEPPEEEYINNFYLLFSVCIFLRSLAVFSLFRKVGKVFNWEDACWKIFKNITNDDPVPWSDLSLMWFRPLCISKRRRQWHPTPVLLPGKSHGWRSLVGCSPWGRKEWHDSATSLSLFTLMHWRRKWQPTPVFLPGESQGQGSLVGCRLWGRTESDTTEAT